MSLMDAPIIPAIGTALEGGFFGGLHYLNGNRYALIVAPKAEGQANNIQWKTDRTATPGVRSLHDGFANSEAMNDDDHPAAKFCRSLRIGGFDDWYLPSRAELNVLAENLMPTGGAVPEQTTAVDFQDEGPESFDECWYWSSTEFNPVYAWGQSFNGGVQFDDRKDGRSHCRAVRKVLI